MRSDRSNTFYNSTIYELPFFRHADGMSKTILGGRVLVELASLRNSSQNATTLSLETGSCQQLFFSRQETPVQWTDFRGKDHEASRLQFQGESED